MKYSREIAVQGEPAEVFAYLADFSNTSEWDPGITEARRLDEPPTRVGSRFEVITNFRGNRQRFEYVVSEYEPGVRIALHGEGEKAQSDDAIEVRAAEGGHTNVRYEAAIELKGVLRVVEPFMRPVFRRMGDAALNGLQARLG